MGNEKEIKDQIEGALNDPPDTRIKRKKIEFETMEPRLLLSADLGVPLAEMADDQDLAIRVQPIVIAMDEEAINPAAGKEAGDDLPVIEGLDDEEEFLPSDDGDAISLFGSGGALLDAGLQDLAQESATRAGEDDQSQLIVVDQSVDGYLELIGSLLLEIESAQEVDTETDTDQQNRNLILGIDLDEIRNAQANGNDGGMLFEGDAGISILILDSRTDGISQISSALTQVDDLAAIHLLTHGASGSLSLGSTELNLDELDDRAEEIAAWRSELIAGGDIALYGCNVAEGSYGVDFVENLAAITGADVAASDDLTGNFQQGGNWQLEYTTGDIEVGTLAAAEYEGLLQE